MVNTLTSFDSASRIKSLSYTQQADALMPGFQSDLIRGCAVAIVRFGVYEAGKMMCQAGVSIRLALALVRYVQHRISLDFTS